MSRTRTLIIVLIIGLGAGAAISALSASSYAQTLSLTSSLFLLGLAFAKFLPFAIGLGILTGLVLALVEKRTESRRIEQGFVRRHSLSDVLLHWTNAVGFLLGIVTGLLVLRWVRAFLTWEQSAIISGYEELIYILHYAGAGLSTFAIFTFITYHGLAGHSGLVPRRGDLRDALGELAGYLGTFGEKGVLNLQLPARMARTMARLLARLGIRRPGQVGKYLATEKALSFPIWAILAGLVLLSGLVKTLRYTSPMPTGVVGLATWVHDLTSIAIVVWLVVHVASTALIPRNWPLLKSIFTTKVPADYVKAHHPAWYRQLRSRELPSLPSEQAKGSELASQVGSD